MCVFLFFAQRKFNDRLLSKFSFSPKVNSHSETPVDINRMDVWIYSIANVSRMECELGEAIYDGNGIQSEQM